MNSTLEVVFGLLGGLAIFLFGMNMMSDCLQKAAGDKMRTILSMLTKNPILGVLAGAVTTAVLQSSSATTVMAIGFVSAGLMTLPQAISIIFGANIGTTMTAQLIAFKLSDYIFIIIFVGFIIGFLAKSEQIKNIGNTILAFGLLFLGIETMGDVMKPLANSEIFVNMIAKVADIPVLGVAVGTLMTLVVQSSSATIAVLQNFAQQPGPDGVTSMIGLAGAIPILFGDNIGTTITALLASIGQNKDAKRTAVAHCTFNISGSLLFIWNVLSDIDRIGDLTKEMAEILEGDESKKTKFSKEALDDLGEALEVIEEMYSQAMKILKTGNQEDAKKMAKKREKVLDLDINMRKAHMDRVAKGICEAKMTSEHNRVLHIVDRMSNSCANIADGALGQVDFKYFANIELSEV